MATPMPWSSLRREIGYFWVMTALSLDSSSLSLPVAAGQSSRYPNGTLATIPLTRIGETVVVRLQVGDQAVDRRAVGILDRAAQGIGEEPLAGVADERLAVLTRASSDFSSAGPRTRSPPGSTVDASIGPESSRSSPFAERAEVLQGQAEGVDRVVAAGAARLVAMPGHLLPHRQRPVVRPGSLRAAGRSAAGREDARPGSRRGSRRRDGPDWSARGRR